MYGHLEKGTFYISALGMNWLMRIIYPIFQQLHVACLKRTGHYMYILISRLYKVLKVILTQVKESLSFIHCGLNICLFVYLCLGFTAQSTAKFMSSRSVTH